MMIAGADPGI